MDLCNFFYLFRLVVVNGVDFVARQTERFSLYINT